MVMDLIQLTMIYIHFEIYTNIESLCCTLETNMVLYMSIMPQKGKIIWKSCIVILL